MAGNINYYIYSICLVIAFCILFVLIKLTDRKRILIAFLILSIPSLILCQTYFWNYMFNSYVKSYIFSSESYACELEEELKNITIPLPERTVFQAKEDSCSPFYMTYSSETEFQTFYTIELSKLKASEFIQNYQFIQEGVHGQKDRSGFFVELTTGSHIVISFQEKDVNHLAITYVRTIN